MTTDLTTTLASLGLTPRQTAELAEDPERAWGWITWLREQPGVTNPAGLLLAKYRTGDPAPDPAAWRNDTPTANPAALHRAAESLVRHTGHQYRPEDIDDELDQLERRIGHGATLTAKERARLHHLADRLRTAETTAELERERRAEAWIQQNRRAKPAPAA